MRPYYAGVDMPFIVWWKDLLMLHPEAKVVLTVRDPIKWRLSCNSAILRAIHSFNSWPSRWFLKLCGEYETVLFMLRMFRAFKVDSLDMTMEEALLSDELATKFFHAHVEEVKSLVPPSN